MDDYLEIRPMFGLCEESPLSSDNHFSEQSYQMAVSGMENEDGTKGPHWDVNEVSDIILKNDINLGENNVYDYAYVLNMVYSDYFGAVKDEEKAYVELANKFIFDKDAPQGKAFIYWRAMH